MGQQIIDERLRSAEDYDEVLYDLPKAQKAFIYNSIYKPNKYDEKEQQSTAENIHARIWINQMYRSFKIITVNLSVLWDFRKNKHVSNVLN